MARVSYTHSPRVSVHRINVAEATRFHIMLDTIRACFSMSLSSSGARNRYTCDGTFSNDLKRLVWDAIVPSCDPYTAQSVSAGTLS